MLSRHAHAMSAMTLCLAIAAVLLIVPATALGTEYHYVAHQGKVNAEFKGNTLPAFEQAAATDGIFGIETDIWRTADGEYVCLHGDDASASWSGMNVSETALSDLRAKTVGGNTLPTLGEYLDICKAGGKYAFIEFKDGYLDWNEDYAAEVVRIVHDHDMLSRCVFVGHISRAAAVHYAKDCARDLYGIDALAHIGSGKTNERVDEAIALAEEYGLDGIGTYPDISQQEYAYERLEGTGMKLRSTGITKDEAHARELIEKYDLWALYCEFTPMRNAVIFKDGISGDTIEIQQVVYGSAAKAPSPPHHEGHGFTGWSQPLSDIVEPTTIVAQYGEGAEATGRTVRFLANGGIGSMIDQPLDSGMTLRLMPNTFKRVGYTFKGWSAWRDGPIVYGDAARVKAPNSPGWLILHAQWEEI